MATSDVIIDYCLKGIGETDVDAPVEMTRAEVLEIINKLYQNDIAERVKSEASYSYDASDSDHTITSGVGTMPSDCLDVIGFYDGDIPTNKPLDLVTDLDNLGATTAPTNQYYRPNQNQFWIRGITPTNTIKLYYVQQPTALADSSSSSPTILKAKFHIDIFVAEVKRVYAMRQNNTYDALDMQALVLDYLNMIAKEHKPKDSSIRTITNVYGGFC